MKNKNTFTFFDTNPLILFCIIFALGIIINGLIVNGLVMGVIFGEPFYIGAEHLIDTAILCVAPVVTIVLFNKVSFLKYFGDDERSLWISVPAHYVVSCVLLVIILSPIAIARSADMGAYLHTLLSYTQGYVAIVIFAIVIDAFKIAKANKSLKKIQESQKGEE